ncbi:hypothetical protein VchM-138_0043 [Vibrio phage vB_VchM-138]|uniref:hypothetical protein n=1 Tax=Vibrio phage vB_VchM-138 TaxID=1127518 RepID=UPI0002536E1A|nr:hypothetical protein F397_gp43 [Vibrio phage vB_VchM-138]AFC22722.1 hypothetical protein VchM-138_0043 [Vibrio phage vB_VchM-138]
MTLSELAVDHPYYCSTINYYNNDSNLVFNTMTEFLDEFENMDPDLNLMFRWDVKRDEDEGDGYYAECFIMLQRKGIFPPCSIKSFKESEVERFVEYARMHRNVLNKMWQPLQ